MTRAGLPWQKALSLVFGHLGSFHDDLVQHLDGF